MSAPQQVEAQGELPGKVFSKMLGEELRRAREVLELSRAQFVALLPSGIGERSMLAYEHGLRQLTALRLIELCSALGVDAPTILGRAMQRARIHLQNLVLQVDLNHLLNDKNEKFRPMHQWARNKLNEHPDGVAELAPTSVRELATFVGCKYEELAKYLARFVPEG